MENKKHMTPYWPDMWWNKPSGGFVVARNRGYVVGSDSRRYTPFHIGMNSKGPSRNRYMPHQGEKEKARRRLQEQKRRMMY